MLNVSVQGFKEDQNFRPLLENMAKAIKEQTPHAEVSVTLAAKSRKSRVFGVSIAIKGPEINMVMTRYGFQVSSVVQHAKNDCLKKLGDGGKAPEPTGPRRIKVA